MFHVKGLEASLHRSGRLCSAQLQSKCLRGGRKGRLLCQRVNAVGWDPDGILAAPRGGHIARRNITKEAEQNKELQAEIEKLKAEEAEEQKRKRDARLVPSSHGQLIEYLLETESQEMQFETARIRPMLTEDFFSYLSKEISSARFGTDVDENRVAELEGLQTFIQDAVKQLDARTEQLAAPAERMRLLLGAKDKKATLLDMAGNNEIDKPLLDLLQQNIDAARHAGQEEPAKFMEKVRDAARKYTMSTGAKS